MVKLVNIHKSDSQFHTTGHNSHFCRLKFFSIIWVCYCIFTVLTKLQNKSRWKCTFWGTSTKVYSVISFIHFKMFLSSSVNRAVKTTLWRTRNGEDEKQRLVLYICIHCLSQLRYDSILKVEKWIWESSQELPWWSIG